MAGSFLLDTNIVIELLNGEPTVAHSIAQAEEILVPAVVIGELYAGAAKLRRAASNAKRIADFAAATTILPTDLASAQVYGQVKDLLRRSGKPIPENDI